MTSEFVGESIEPVAEAIDSARMATGEPGLPRRFRWRGAEHTIVEVIESRRETGACTHGSGERYVRRHWYRVRTGDGTEMKISFDRRSANARQMRDAWRLHSLVRPA